MRLLVLSGTRFLGPAIVDAALSRGHHVATFSRGLSGRPPPGAETLRGDRASDSDLRRLAGRQWDAVIDTSVIAPAHVAVSAGLLGPRAHYTYVSSLSVYRRYPAAPVTEDSEIFDSPPDAAGDVGSLGCAELKAGAERAVARAAGGRALIARPGLILGPRENVGRLPWWLTRMARGGAVIAPGDPRRRVLFTDVRDLAAWLVQASERRVCGTMNVAGSRAGAFGDLPAECARVTAPVRRQMLDLRWVPDEALLAAGVQPWTELPMWAPAIPEWAGVWEVSDDRARAAGMTWRPLADTVRGAWDWLRGGLLDPAAALPAFESRPGIGLGAAKERGILTSLARSAGGRRGPGGQGGRPGGCGGRGRRR